MAIIVTRKDCTLSEANAFYRVEASNMSFISTTSTIWIALNVYRYYPLTFANVGNFTGFGFCLYSASVTAGRSIYCDLQHGRTATLAVASPGVVGLTGHGIAVGAEVNFTTGGTLPTGIVSNTIYYARNTDCSAPLNEFWVYGTAAQAIAGGATGRINFTGTSSGTHTCWNTVASQSKTWDTIRGNFSSPVSADYDTQGQFLTDYRNFSANPTITTTANEWRMKMYQGGGSGGGIAIMVGADSVTPSYWAYCDTQVTYADGDTPIFANYCDIDKSTNFNSVLGTGETAYGTAGVICSNETDCTVANVCFLRCLTPAASYTLEVRGKIFYSGHGGMRVGTSAVPIPTANRFILNWGEPTVGTVRGGFTNPCGSQSGGLQVGSRSSLFFYGAYPTQIRTTLTNSTTSVTGNVGRTVTMTAANPCVVTLSAHGLSANAPVVFTTTGALPTGGTTDIVAGTTYYVKTLAVGTFKLSATPGGADISTAGGTQSGVHFFGAAETIVVAEDMSTKGWGIGDTIIVGKQAVTGIGDLTQLKIAGITGTSITLTTTIPAYNRLSGASVFNLTASKYGINIVDIGTNTWGVVMTNLMNNLVINGTYIKGCYFQGIGASGRYYDDDATANCSLWEYKNSVVEMNGTTGGYTVLLTVRVPRLGLTLDNVWSQRVQPYWGNTVAYATPWYVSGVTTINNLGVMSRYQTNAVASPSRIKALFTNIYFENGSSVSGTIIPLPIIRTG